MSKLTLVKSEPFCNIECDIYKNDDSFCMTAVQLRDCLGESKSTFDSRITRHPKLKSEEFSVVRKMRATDGKMYNTRLFNEDGIYEITMLSDSEKGSEFRAHIRRLLKALRRGEVTIEPTNKRRLGEVNSAARIIRQTLKEAGMAPQFTAVAVRSLYAPLGIEIPLDGITVEKRLFDATAIANRLGMYSKSGKPHNQAVAAIIAQIPVDAHEREVVPFQNSGNGHSGTNYQYTESVVSKISSWLAERNYPAAIQHNGKIFSVTYQQADGRDAS